MKKKEKDLIVKLDRWWSEDLNARKKYDWKWFLSDLWVKGYHYTNWNKQTERIEPVIEKRGRPQIVVNQVRRILRSIRNFSLRNKPIPETIPDDVNDETIEQANNINKYLRALHEKLKLKRKMMGLVWNALKYVGYWQVLWDEDLDDGKGGFAINEIDPYDLYWDKDARFPEEANRVTLAVNRRISDLEHDSKYDKKEVAQLKGGDNKKSASDLKSRLIQLEKGGSGIGSNKKDGTVIVRETWYWENENSKRNLYVCAIANGKLIRKPELVEGFDRLPFFKLDSMSEPLSMFGPGWVKDLIPLNKILNSAVSSIVEYNDVMNKAKLLEEKGAGVRVINNEHGQRIIHKKGYDVSPYPVPQLNPAIYQQVDYATSTLEDIGGAHEATMGRVPTGAKSGKAIEALQVGDSNNMSELVENLETFLSEVYEFILHVASQKYQFARNVSPVTTMGQREIVTVIGEEAEAVPEDATVIRKKNMVRVRIASQLAQTPQGKREAILEMSQVLPDIDPQTVLEAYEIGNIADVIERMKARRKDQQDQELQQQQAQGQLQNNLNQQSAESAQPQSSGQQEARAALRSILNGQNPTVPDAINPEFIRTLDMFIQREQSNPSQDMTPEILRVIQIYRDNVVQKAQTQAR